MGKKGGTKRKQPTAGQPPRKVQKSLDAKLSLTRVEATLKNLMRPLPIPFDLIAKIR